MTRLSLLLLIVLGLVAFVSAHGVAVDTEISLQSSSTELTPEVAAELTSVHDAVAEAENLLEDEFIEPETAFVEIEAELESTNEGEAETEADAEMEESLGLDADSEYDALFVETDAAAEGDAEVVATMDVDGEAEMFSDVDAEHELDAESGSVVVADGEADH